MLNLLPFVMAFAAQRVIAHGGVVAYVNDGTYYNGWRAYNSEVGQITIQRPWLTYDPIQDVTTSSLSCNNDGASGPNQLTAVVAAGSDVTAYWNEWPHNTGPVTTYLAQCPGTTCTGIDSATLSWFKIDEAGLVSGTVGSGTWAAGVMMANNNSWTSTIPSSIPSGQYLIRFETIALHSLPAQIYPECAQIEIVGGGSRAPTSDELVKFPGGYSATDPGLTVNLYSGESQTSTTYVIPGPPLYGKGTASTVSSVPSSSSAAAAVSTSTIPTTTSVSPVTSLSSSSRTSSPASSAPALSSSSSSKPALSSASTSSVQTSAAGTSMIASSTAPTATPGLVAQFGQCGGANHKGSTTCASPFVCVKQNDWYSQCLTGSTTTAALIQAPAASPVTPTPTAAVARWGQCGGENYTGSTSCGTPYQCIKLNDYYSQCL